MRSLTLCGFLLSICAIPCSGQVPYTVTGTVQSNTGALATSGSVTFRIRPSSQSILYYIAGTTVIAPQIATCGINASGLIKNATNLANPCTVWGNDQITPGNTTYDVTFAPNGVTTNMIHQVGINSVCMNLNSPCFLPVINVVPQYQTITTSPIAVNLIPAVAHVFNVGNVGFPYAAGYFDNLFVTSFNITTINATNVNTTNLNTTNLTVTGTFPSHTWYGNNTGISAAPGVESIGLTDIGPGITSTGTYDFSPSTITKLHVGAGYVPSSNGEIGFNSTTGQWVAWVKQNATLVNGEFVTTQSGQFAPPSCAQWEPGTTPFIGDGLGGNCMYSTTHTGATALVTTLHQVIDVCTLGTNCVVTFSGAAPFSNTGGFDCFARDATTPANAVTVALGPGTGVTFTGTGTDVVHYICTGF